MGKLLGFFSEFPTNQFFSYGVLKCTTSHLTNRSIKERRGLRGCNLVSRKETEQWLAFEDNYCWMLHKPVP